MLYLPCNTCIKLPVQNILNPKFSKISQFVGSLHEHRIGVVQLLALVSCSPQKWLSGLYIKFKALLVVRARTSLFLRCTSCSGCERISSSQHINYFFCFVCIQHSIIYCGHHRSLWFSCELISADYGLTQSAEMIFWTVHQHQAVSTCDNDSLSVRLFLFGDGQHYSIHWGH